MKVTVGKITKLSLLYAMLAGFGAGSFVLYLLIAISAAFEAGTLTLELEFSIGNDGFFGTMLAWPFFTILWVLATWSLTLLGWWILGKIRPVQINTTED